MSTPAEREPRSIFTYRSALLPSESQGDYDWLDREIREHIHPRNVVEEAWTAELRDIAWDMRRLRQFRHQIVNSVRSEALENLLRSITNQPDREIADLARRSSSNKAIRSKVSRMLNAAGLDESAIDAEAYHLSLESVGYFDRQLLSLAQRRDAVIRQIDDYRAGTSAPIRASKQPDLDSDGED